MAVIVLTVTKSAFPKGLDIIKAQIMGAPVGTKPVWNRATPGKPSAYFGDATAYADTASGNPLINSYLYHAPAAGQTLDFKVSATVGEELISAELVITG